MKAYIQTKSRHVDGSYDSFLTTEVECKTNPLWWQTAGLSYTASGYGSKIPTQYMVKYNGRWHRVYCCSYSNSGTLFIGKTYTNTCNVRIDND